MNKYFFAALTALVIGGICCAGCNMILNVVQKEIAQEQQILGDISLSYNPRIEKLQTYLASIGYSCGMVDGQMGFKTRTAVKAFQSDFDIEPHGYVDRMTWERLKREYRTVGKPLANLTVTQTQAALKNAGFNPGPIDGKRGKRTSDAIKAFQSAHGLEPDGKVGIHTWRELKEFVTDP